MNKTRLLSLAIRTLATSWRFDIYGALLQPPAILAFWHDEMLPVWKFFSLQENVALTSHSRDGDLLAEVLKDWHYKVVRGSSTKGGKEALHEIVALARDNLVLMTPDGSRGPRHECKPGAVVAAQRAQVPLHLCRAVYNGYRLEKSWDKFHIPFPLCGVELIISEALHIPAEAGREEVSEYIRHCDVMLNESLPRDLAMLRAERMSILSGAAEPEEGGAFIGEKDA